MDDASPVDRSTIGRLARLARVPLDDDEIEALTADLVAILAYVEKLAACPDESVASGPFDTARGRRCDTAQDRPASAPLREDRVEPGLSVSESLSSAPHKRGEGFGVPRVLE